jgi:murein DD-endopeptidase MepM/ murein hydrolase activator NlpD
MNKQQFFHQVRKSRVQSIHHFATPAASAAASCTHKSPLSVYNEISPPMRVDQRKGISMPSIPRSPRAYLSAFALLACTFNGWAVDIDPDMAWPLCGRISENPPPGWSAPDGCPAGRFGNAAYSDEPVSATFGPRPLASESNRFDFHRGVDIATPAGTPFFAVADGIVRIAGIDSGYSDPLVSLRHFRPGETSCSVKGCYHSLYLHISAWVVSPDQPVVKGQLLGYTGASDSGFTHLHFEVRDAPASDPFSAWSRDAIHPLSALTYSAANDTSIVFNVADLDDPNAGRADLTITSNRFDLVSVDLELFDANQQPVPQAGNIPNLNGYYVLPSFWDMELANFMYSHKDSSAFPWESYGAGGANECPYHAEHGASYNAQVHLDAQHPDDYHEGLQWPAREHP